MGSEMEYAALGRQVEKVRRLEEDHNNPENGKLLMEEINKERESYISRINKAGESYQAEFNKKAGREVIQKNEKGEVTGFDFGESDDIYGQKDEAPRQAKESKPEAPKSDDGGDLVRSGVEKAKESKSDGADSVSRANEVEGA